AGIRLVPSRFGKRRLTRELPKCLYELHHLAFGPATIVLMIAIRFANEGAVTAVCRFDESDIRICQNTFARFGPHSDKRIIRGMDDQCRDRDSIDHVGSGGASVIVIGSGETAVEGGNPVIKPSQTVDSL